MGATIALESALQALRDKSRTSFQGQQRAIDSVNLAIPANKEGYLEKFSYGNSIAGSHRLERLNGWRGTEYNPDQQLR